MFGRLERFLGLRTNPYIFFPSALFIALFVPAAALFNEAIGGLFGGITSWVAANLGWFYILSVTSLLGFLLWIAISRFGGIRLGDDDARPEYSNVAWFTMLFAAGIGTILMFWGVAEPISHFASPPRGDVPPETVAAARQAMNFTLYHFALHTWTIFAMPGLAIAYFVYRHKLPPRISSIFYPLLGERVYGPIGWTIDVIAVIGTMFGVATSLGLGTLQVNSGLSHLFGVPDNDLSRVIIITLITLAATCSVALGLDKGIRRLSELNILMATGLLLFVLFAGPTVFLLQGTVESMGNYLAALVPLSFWNQAYNDTGWQQNWTVFYWAWTISWAPFVGIFVARISRGRTIREFVAGVLLAPVLFSICWFGIFGMAALNIELNGGGGLIEQVDENVAIALFAFLENFPLSRLTSGLGILIVVIFFATSADSASLVMDMLSSGDEQTPPTRQRVFWALAGGSVAGSLLLLGGFDALQNVITTLGFPFCLLLVFMAVMLVRALQRDYAGQTLR
ncbi:MAG: multidrug DMT transporter permease [Salinisphaeraceae bacterium]|nr:multidrug DMT transporter permease [Salinisphaeraceae bacterium]